LIFGVPAPLDAKYSRKPRNLPRFGRIGRGAEKSRKVLDPLHVVMLGFCRELADRHVFDHAPAQRVDGHVGREHVPASGEVDDAL